MVKGKQGLYLEAWKFGVYISIPIFASYYYSDPARVKATVEYWQYVKVPPNPNAGMKQRIEEMLLQEQKQKAYLEQIRIINENTMKAEIAQKQFEIDEINEKSSRRYGWLRWIGLGRKE